MLEKNRNFNSFGQYCQLLTYNSCNTCRTVLGEEETLTNCLLFRFHVSAFLFEFMFWKAAEIRKYTYNLRKEKSMQYIYAYMHHNLTNSVTILNYMISTCLKMQESQCVMLSRWLTDTPKIFIIIWEREICLLTEVAGKAVIEVSIELSAMGFLKTSA